MHTEANNHALTLLDYLTHHFADNSKVVRVISALEILVFLLSIVSLALSWAYAYLKAPSVSAIKTCCGLARLRLFCKPLLAGF